MNGNQVALTDKNSLVSQRVGEGLARPGRPDGSANTMSFSSRVLLL